MLILKHKWTICYPLIFVIINLSNQQATLRPQNRWLLLATETLPLTQVAYKKMSIDSKWQGLARIRVTMKMNAQRPTQFRQFCLVILTNAQNLKQNPSSIISIAQNFIRIRLLLDIHEMVNRAQNPWSLRRIRPTWRLANTGNSECITHLYAQKLDTHQENSIFF